ncbi:hypothetical protein [Oligosphaera ethanolica]|uniref:Uncharacterized protein n=1 Tax=Oligosphaera ethanolica TaxID=760260 RepID=A0AAE3VHS2_9BACT|nr:hypothetical protein [Oligosphaera ethanolica]MDQ0290543.1 hypothetical protein [Oligosphaera ethanolica]
MNTSWTDDEWYNFLDDLSSNSGRYVPVIGPELMVYQEGERTVSVYQLLGERLADKLRVDRKQLPAAFGLGDVIRSYQLRRGDFTSAMPYASIAGARPKSPGESLV